MTDNHTETNTEIENYIESLCAKAKSASPALSVASAKLRNGALISAAELIKDNKGRILEANSLDMSSPGVPAKMLDRLKLTESRIDALSDSLISLAGLPDPLGSGETFTRPNGLVISRIKVPLGVVAMIYEARPNVTVDAAAICIKTGNSVVLRGGKEAINTNRVLADILRSALKGVGLPEDGVCLIDDTTREGTKLLMGMRKYIDVLVPRGGAGLIRSVVENARVPVIETGAGNCHIYVDESADIEKAVNITLNAKISRPSVCNAAESLVVHKNAAEKFLPVLSDEFGKAGVELRGCPRTLKILPDINPASDEDFYTEYNDLIMSVIIVDSLEDAIAHINSHSTHHSEAIITENLSSAAKFKANIDSAAVYVNASTRFTDGGEFGFGAELGISTQKLHARGPMGLDALTSVKYLIDGNGQTR